MKYLVPNRVSLEPSKRKDGRFNLLIEMVTLRDANFKYLKHAKITEKIRKLLEKAKIPVEEWTDE